MSDRHLPVRPNLDQLKHQAKDLLRALHAGETDALDDWKRFHPKQSDPIHAKLADAQLILARSYQAPNWPRLVLACRLVDAIWQDDLEAVRTLIAQRPSLLFEDALVRKSNWGPPMSYAANLGRDRIIGMLHAMGAKDHRHALGRAALQSKIETAGALHTMMGKPRPDAEELGGPAYTLSASGTALLLEMGAAVIDTNGKRLAPVDVVLETDGRNPANKHAILEMYEAHGLTLPDTPTMAVHRGRIDLLEQHLRRDPALLSRTFTHEEIYPPEMGCHEEVLATNGTPLSGATLLHICMDYAEMEIARWLLARGMDVNARAAVNADGFGGHTALFATVVSQPNFWANLKQSPDSAEYTRLLLQHGADVHVRASLRKQLHPGYEDNRIYEFHSVTPVEWGQQFQRQEFVSKEAMRLIAEAGA